jgi:phenylalanyl-tRNA synthetase alpha chain
MNLQSIRKEATKKIKEAATKQALFEVEVEYLGRKGKLSAVLKTLGSLSLEEKKKVGAEANSLKIEIEELISKRSQELLGRVERKKIDVTAPGTKLPQGHVHPVSLIFEELVDIAKSLGFSVATGPDIETDWYNFEALNIPKNHPARDTQDSFYFTENSLLRTHTSPVQIRYMESHKPPIRVVAPGKTYRRDSDATHTPMFHQLEGLLIDEGVSISELKGTLEYFVQTLFGVDRKIRLRPHYFPFTEPSMEVDVSCGICKGKGCRSCKHTGWLEILGAGMVHPNVLRAGGIDPDKYQGFAFGMGIERIAMLKYGVDDMRMLYEGDLRLVEQF